MCQREFAQAVAQAVGRNCCQPGTQALGTHSRSIQSNDTRALAGSVDLDGCLKTQYPDVPRWDFAVGYGKCRLLVFVEVHGAKVGDIIAKKQWLDGFLEGQGAALSAWAGRQVFAWVPTQGGFRKGSPQAKALASKGITTGHKVWLRC